MACSGLTPITDWLGPVSPRSVTKPSPWGSTWQSAVGTCIYETAIPGSGIFKGCEVTYARGNVLHISQGFGMIRGRFFEVYETEIDVRLAEDRKSVV